MAEQQDGDSYEAMVFSANLPTRTIAFIYRDGGPRLAGGIYRITRVRSATEQDHIDFASPKEGFCPLCDAEEQGW